MGGLDLEDDDESGADLDLARMSQTGRECPLCCDHVHFTDEVAFLQIKQVCGSAPGSTYVDYLLMDGDFVFEPAMVHLECWESNVEDLEGDKEDVPPVLHPDGLMECCLCKSSILEKEYVCEVVIGEVIVSRRSPNNVPAGVTFKPNGEAKYYCIACAVGLDEDTIWTSLSQTGECPDCTRHRCWRSECSCTCHED